FRPTAGRVYRLTLDVNPDISASTDWFSLGFTQANNVGNWHDGGNNATAWMLNREDDASTSTIQTFLGPVTAGAGSHDLNPDVTGVNSLEIILDTRPAAWTVQWIANGTTLRGPEAFGTNPTINY